MMNPASLTPSSGLALHVGPFTISLSSNMDSLLTDVEALYEGRAVLQERLSEPGFYDFHMAVDQVGGLRRWFRPQIKFLFDGHQPFKPLPKSQALAQFEWGLNWTITTHCHEYLIIHAAVVEKNGCVLMLSAPPGSGKSTLCAGLVSKGWRLLSDELALLNLTDIGNVVPLARPICLKNQSIEVIQKFSDGVRMGPTCQGTTKGTVAHMLAPTESVRRCKDQARLRWIVFPQYMPNTPTNLLPRSKAQSLWFLARQAFNFHILGDQGFHTLNQLVSRSDCFDFYYSNLHEAVTLFDSMAEQMTTDEVSYAV